MDKIPLILQVFAFVLFVVSAWLSSAPTVDPWRWRLIPIGLACWVASVIVSGVHTFAT